MDSSKVETENSGIVLKRLGFVRVIAIYTLVCLSKLYDFAKQNSGPLRSTVGTVEKAVTTVVGPVYEKFKSLPTDLLVFVDGKVDGIVGKYDKHAPPSAKKAVGKAQNIFQQASQLSQNLLQETPVNGLVEKATQAAQNIAQEAKTGGPFAAVNSVINQAKTVYIHMWLNLIETFCFTLLARFWYAANKITLFHILSQLAMPSLAYWSQVYNKTVEDLNGKGYTIFGYFPQIPVDEISKAYKQVEAEKGPAAS